MHDSEEDHCGEQVRGMEIGSFVLAKLILKYMVLTLTS